MEEAVRGGWLRKNNRSIIDIEKKQRPDMCKKVEKELKQETRTERKKKKEKT